jgi:hypothetical protein
VMNCLDNGTTLISWSSKCLYNSHILLAQIIYSSFTDFL